MVTAKHQVSELKESKKFAIGSQHKTAQGTIEILDRYLGDENMVYLKYKELATGAVKKNKEVNVNAMIYKWSRSQAAKGVVEAVKGETSEALIEIGNTVHENHDMINKLLDLGEHTKSTTEQLAERIQHLEKHVEEQSRTIDLLMDIAKQLVNDRDIIKKLVEKL